MINKISLNTQSQKQIQPAFNGTIIIKPIVKMSASYMKNRTHSAISYLINSIPDSEIIGRNYTGVRKILFVKFHSEQYIKIKYKNKYKEEAKKAVKSLNTLKFYKNMRNFLKSKNALCFNDIFKITLKK